MIVVISFSALFLIGCFVIASIDPYSGGEVAMLLLGVLLAVWGVMGLLFYYTEAGGLRESTVPEVIQYAQKSGCVDEVIFSYGLSPTCGEKVFKETADKVVIWPVSMWANNPTRKVNRFSSSTRADLAYPCKSVEAIEGVSECVDAAGVKIVRLSTN